MSYESLIKTISLIIDNEFIEKKGLTLVYTLSPSEYDKLNEAVYFKTNPYGHIGDIDKTINEFEIFINGLLIIIKKIA